MFPLTHDYIVENVAATDLIFQRGTNLYNHGSFTCVAADYEKGHFTYSVDGNYGDYTTQIEIDHDALRYECDCPYPHDGCKHTVAVMLDVHDKLVGWQQPEAPLPDLPEKDPSSYLNADEIKAQALEDRKKRAKTEAFTFRKGDMYKGMHLVETPKGRQYQVTLHDPESGKGHCTCPDFSTNRLGTCKHLIFLSDALKRQRGFKKQVSREKFPFVDVFWDSEHDRPRLFSERPAKELKDIQKLLDSYFDEKGLFREVSPAAFVAFASRLQGHKKVYIQEPVFERINDLSIVHQLSEMAAGTKLPSPKLRATLYPYQKKGVDFALFKQAALIGDEMGLGKTLQAITLSVLKKEIFGFKKVLVITLASLKEQWKREIERFTDEKAVIVAGTPRQRKDVYTTDPSFFKITNYEAVLRDVTIIRRFKPDLVILDEAQRIKNFNTKTADAVKLLPRKHALVLTGTPLENKLEDVYSIVQFLDPHMLSPLWQFAADHFMLSRSKKGKILGYRNLDLLHEKLKSIVIRRKKEAVLRDLPDEVVNNYYLELSREQADIHAGYAQLLMPLLNKKYLTPVDLQRMMKLLLKMRQVCNTTYLIDRETNISPKLKELEGILDELVLQNDRKVVIFTEWTTMTYLIAKHLSRVGIPFVELTGKIPVKKRQALIDEFTNNPACKVFLSTDAGGTGLNLQAADCVINFELPWNPAKMNQRIGRVNRIGQQSRCVNVVNLITKNSIEEKILAGIQLKTDLFEGVFDGGKDVVEFSREKRTELLNRLREMLGDEPELLSADTLPPEEIPEDTPHYLNPQALAENGEDTVAYDVEEPELEQPSSLTSQERTTGPVMAQTPEKMETVLNSGMQFISGLIEMATGQKIEATGGDDRMIRLDKETGEVTMKFKLPGF